ncbi:MAG: universal stress protein [Anaerolineae bacterium]|jgi:nucleotide-binding universal stress UspA family protein
MYKRVLIPLDGSALAEQALPHAIAQAKHFEAELIPLQVLALLPSPPLLGEVARSRAKASSNVLAREYLERVVASAQEHDIPVQVATAQGSPPVAITRFAEAHRVDLIVMSTRGQSGLSRWLMGSVADRVVRGATVPVLMVRTRKENA